MIDVHDLEVGKTYSAKAQVPLMPVHSDDFDTIPGEQLWDINYATNPVFEVLEVRGKVINNNIWYRVKLSDETTGWINCIALMGKEVTQKK